MDLETTLIYFINDGILAGKSPNTLNRYQYTVRLLFNYFRLKFLPLNTSSLTKENLQSFMVYGIKVRQWNKVTQWTMHLKLSAYFNWCVKKGYLTVNPLAEIPKPKMVQQPPKALDEQEVLMILKAVSAMKSKYQFINIRNKALIATFLFTGLRRSELIDLKYQDVDLANGFITIEHGKGDKRREIPIEDQTLRPILEEYVEYRNRLGRAETWFFTGAWSGFKENNKLPISVLDRLFKQISNLCHKRIHPHKLRHTFATLLLDKGGDLYTLKELMGHSNISTTCIYLSSTRRKKIEEINKLRFKSN